MHTNHPANSITGLILAGGMSSRMGGKDKGLIRLNNKPLIEHVLERLRPQVETIIISCNRNLGEYRRLGFPIVTDEDKSTASQAFNGPIAGILAGLRSVRSEFCLLAPCDCPKLPMDLSTRLYLACKNTGLDIAVPYDGEIMQPLFMLFRSHLIDSLNNYYLEGGRSAKKWLSQHKIAAVNFCEKQSFFTNLNTPEDLSSYK